MHFQQHISALLILPRYSCGAAWDLEHGEYLSVPSIAVGGLLIGTHTHKAVPSTAGMEKLLIGQDLLLTRHLLLFTAPIQGVVPASCTRCHSPCLRSITDAAVQRKSPGQSNGHKLHVGGTLVGNA